MDEARQYRTESYDLAYQAGIDDDHSGIYDGYEFTCEHHIHYDEDGTVWPDGQVLHQLNALGGCFINAGHTHHMTGSCPYRSCGYSETIESYRAGGFGERGPCGNCGSTNTETVTLTTQTHPECGRVYKYGTWFCNACQTGNSFSSSNGITCPGIIYTCGSYVNTWRLGCGKTKDTVEYRDFMFTDVLQACSFDFASRGVLKYVQPDGSNVLLDMNELVQMAGELDGIFLGYRLRAVDGFVSACRARKNSHGIDHTEYIYHEHSDSCYEASELKCCETEGVTADGIRVYYQ